MTKFVTVETDCDIWTKLHNEAEFIAWCTENSQYSGLLPKSFPCFVVETGETGSGDGTFTTLYKSDLHDLWQCFNKDT